MPKRTEVGNRVIGLRERRRWSQHELAREAGVSRSWIGAVEDGDIRTPGGDKLAKIANALGVSVEFLLQGPGTTRQVTMRVPADSVSRVGRFVRTQPRIQEALMNLIDGLERSLGLPFEEVEQCGDQLPGAVSEHDPQDEADEQPPR